jgi:hypothetical protein
MEQKQRTNLPRTSLIYLLVCGALAVGFLALGILPLKKTLESRDADILRLKAQVQEQRTLSPVYKSLEEKTLRNGSQDLPLTVRTGLPVDRIDSIPAIVKGITEKNDIELISVIPDVKSLGENSRHLSVRVAAKGDYFNFRKFLLALDELPCLEYTEDIQVQVVPGGKEFRLKIWLAIDGTKGNGKA